MSLGYTPVRGYIKSAFSFGETVFVPDYKKKNTNYIKYKHNKNSSLSQIDVGDLMVHVSHGVGKFGRCLGSLHVGDINVNKVLVSEGHANEYFGGKR